MRHDLRHRLLGLALVALALAGAWRPAPGAAAGHGFATLEEAATALVSALRSGDTKAILGVLGPEGGGLVSSGDRVADRRTREAFVAAYDEQHRFEAGGGKVILVVGKEDFPLPIPLVPEGIEWRFDTVAGKQEILNRRIGQNELNTIQVCLAIVDAQREYYVRDPDRNGVLQYAQKFASTPGRHDGLYWPTRPGESPSPLGDLVVRARSEGYRKPNDAPVPYWGYYYRILNSQGKDAPGGAYSYLAHGRMMGGFAVVAYPAQYGVSGVMTFLVNHDGVVYQKDLGPGSATLAKKMAEFNPDATWKKS